MKVPFLDRKKDLSFRVVGITGSYGKTSTIEIVERILRDNGFKVGYLSSQSYSLDGSTTKYDLSANTITRRQLNKFVKEANQNNLDLLILEMPVEQLAKGTFKNIKMDTGAVLNMIGDSIHISHWAEEANSYLSFIKNIENEGLLIIDGNNLEATSWLHKRGDEIKNHIFVYWAAFKNFKESNIDFKSTEFTTEDDIKIISKILGIHNAHNLYVAAKICHRYITLDKISNSILKIHALRGKFNLLTQKDRNFLIDYANTPYAMEEMLKFLHKNANSRIITVVGSKGDHPNKIRKIGESATKYSDVVILAPNDPNKENTFKINSDIFAHSENENGVLVERFSNFDELNYVNRDNIVQRMGNIYKSNETPVFSFDSHSYKGRLDAIKFAIELSKPNDIIFLAGKGDDRTILFNNIEYEWSDFDAIDYALGV